MSLFKLFSRLKGGSGSGNFGHGGRPGKHGGSTSGGGLGLHKSIKVTMKGLDEIGEEILQETLDEIPTRHTEGIREITSNPPKGFKNWNHFKSEMGVSKVAAAYDTTRDPPTIHINTVSAGNIYALKHEIGHHIARKDPSKLRNPSLDTAITKLNKLDDAQLKKLQLSRHQISSRDEIFSELYKKNLDRKKTYGGFNPATSIEEILGHNLDEFYKR